MPACCPNLNAVRGCPAIPTLTINRFDELGIGIDKSAGSSFLNQVRLIFPEHWRVSQELPVR